MESKTTSKKEDKLLTPREAAVDYLLTLMLRQDTSNVQFAKYSIGDYSVKVAKLEIITVTKSYWKTQKQFDFDEIFVEAVELYKTLLAIRKKKREEKK